MSNDDFSLAELEAQHTAELPARQLMTGLGFGIDLLGIAGVEVYVGADALELYAGADTLELYTGVYV